MVGDHQLLVLGLRHSIEGSGWRVVPAGPERGVEALLRLVRDHAADLVLVLAPLQADVVQLLEGLRGSRERVRSVVLHAAGDPDDDDLVAALSAGADGWLSADIDPRVLARTLHAVVDGEAALSRADVGRLLLALRRRAASPGVRLTDGRSVDLTAREREVLDGLAEGGSTRGIASSLRVSESTVRWYVSSLTTKFGAGSRAELVELLRAA